MQILRGIWKTVTRTVTEMFYEYGTSSEVEPLADNLNFRSEL